MVEHVDVRKKSDKKHRTKQKLGVLSRKFSKLIYQSHDTTLTTAVTIFYEFGENSFKESVVKNDVMFVI